MSFEVDTHIRVGPFGLKSIQLWPPHPSLQSGTTRLQTHISSARRDHLLLIVWCVRQDDPETRLADAYVNGPEIAEAKQWLVDMCCLRFGCTSGVANG